MDNQEKQKGSGLMAGFLFCFSIEKIVIQFILERSHSKRYPRGMHREGPGDEIRMHKKTIEIDKENIH